MKTKKAQFYMIALFALVATAGGIFVFSQFVQKGLKDSAYVTLEEVMQQQRLTFVSRIEDETKSLKTVASLFEKSLFGQPSREEVAAILESVASNGIFEPLVIVGTDGIGLSSNNRVLDLNDREYFQRSMGGETFVSDPFVSPLDEKRYIVISTPMYNEGIYAVLVGFLRIEELPDLFHTSFQNNGAAYVCTASGDIIAKTASNNTGNVLNLMDILKQVDVLEFDTPEEILSNALNGRGGRSEYRLKGDHRLMRYEPIGISDWYIMSVVRFDYVSNELEQIMLATIILSAYILLAFVSIFFVYFRDYRKLLRSEKMLGEAEEYNHLMLDCVPVGCTLWNRDAKCIACNKAILEMHGLSGISEFISRFHELSPKFQPGGGLSSDLADKKIKQVFESGYDEFEWLHQKLNGENLPVHVTLVRVKFKDDYIVAGFAQDLTEVKAAEAHMREAEEYSRLMLNATPLSCSLWDRDIKIITCNDETLRLFGYSTKAEYMAYFPDCSPKYQPNGKLSKVLWREYLLESFKKGYLRFEWTHIDSSGKSLPTEVTLVRVKYGDDYIVASYTRDISETKTMLAEMERRKRIEAERDATERSAKAKLQFLANMSHEIRTPMNAIVGMSELLSESPLSKGQYGYVRDIKVSADTLLDIINDILDFSKLESGKMELVQKSYNFKVFLDHVTSMTRHVAKRKGLEFNVIKQGDMPEFLLGDQVRLKQVLWNILGNAVKYTEQGSVTFTISALPDKLRFDVTDTGLGIKKEDLVTLFDPFARFDRDKNYHVTGTGLGLSIVKGYVELMDGSISVTSEYQQGTTFSVIIPKIIGEAVPDEDGPESESERIVECHAKVLVVDDNEINLNVASGLFGSLGVSIITADSGFRAVEMIKSGDYDLVFMDHMMPEMDGIEATRIIRSLGERYNTLPIIALTANAIKGAKEMFLAQGMDDFLSKPINKRELNKKLIKWLPKDKIRLKTTTMEAEPGEKDDESGGIREQISRAIPGLNVEIGLSRSGGDWETYQKSVEIFIKRVPDYINSMNQSLSDTDLKNYGITVHGLKGALSTLGANGLSGLAADLENAAKAGDMDYCKNKNQSFIEQLTELRQSLSEILPDKSTATGDLPLIDPDYLLEQIGIIKNAIEAYDGDTALAAINGLLGYAISEADRERLTKARDSLEQFNFDDAGKWMSK